MFMNAKRWVVWLVIGLLVVVGTACGAKEASKTEGTASPAAAASASPVPAAEPRVVKDAMGHEVTVPAQPQRIIAPFLEDSLTALGVKPAAQWSAGGVPQQYLQSYLKDVPLLTMEGGLKPEQALGYNPDLIIFMAPTYMASSSYEEFAKIAPTFVLSDNESDWQGNLQKLGSLLGKDDEVKSALAAYEHKLADAKQKLQAAVGDKTAVLLQPGGEKGFKLFGPKFYSGELLYALGFKQPQLLKGDYESYSLESLAQLDDVDYLFVLSGEGRAKPPVDNPLWPNLPAVKAGHVFEADSGHWFNANLIANGMIIDDVLNKLAP